MLKSFEIKNFMSIEHAVLDFDDSNVINLKGYNDSGKSNVIRALRVAMADAWPQKQKKFIRNGTNSFRITLNFTDGVTIVKEKFLNGNSGYEMSVDGEVVYSNKVGSTNTAVRGVPEEIQTYLNLVMVTDGEYLNFQSNHDRQFLVETKGAENVELLNGVLKIKETTLAQNAIKHDMNMVLSNINTNVSRFEGNRALIAQYTFLDEELIDGVQRACREEASFSDRLSVVSSARESAPSDGVSEILSIGTLSLIEGGESLAVLESATSSLEGLVSSNELPPTLTVMDSSNLVQLNSALGSLSKVSDFQESYVTLSPVDSSGLKVLDFVRDSLKSLREYELDYLGLLAKGDLLKSELHGYRLDAVEQGLDYVECTSCGEYVLVGGSHAD